MKHLIVALAVVGMIVAVPASAALTKDLSYGTSDPEVSELQEFLTAEELYTGPITGNFFALTLQAVKRFQLRENIKPVSGYFGPITRARVSVLIKNEATDESVSSTLAVSNTTSTIQRQLDLLLKQLDVLKAQALAQAETNQRIGTLDQTLQNQQTVLQNQQNTLNQIAQNTTPPPVQEPVLGATSTPLITDFTFTAGQPYDQKETWTIKTIGEPFVIEAMTVSATSTYARQRLYGGGNDLMLGDYLRVGFNECQAVDELFLENTSAPYPYPCPAREAKTPEQYQAVSVMGYTLAAKDWLGRPWRNLTISPDQTMKLSGFPIGTKLEYLKAVGQTTGKIVEIR